MRSFKYDGGDILSEHPSSISLHRVGLRPPVKRSVRGTSGFRLREWYDRRMARSARKLFEEAMRLDPKERATLMRLLVDTLDAESEEGSEDAWRAEVERRIAELDAGAVETVPWEELRARLYQR